MNALTHMLVTIAKTPVNDTQIPPLMETIRNIICHALSIGILSFFILIFLGTLISDLRQLRNGEQEEEEEEERPRSSGKTKSQNP